MLYKLSLMFLAASAVLAIASGEDHGHGLTIKMVREDIARAVSKQKSALKEYAKEILTGSAEKASTGKEACVEHNIRQFAVAAEALRYLGEQRGQVAAHHLIRDKLYSHSPPNMRDSFAKQGQPIESYAALHKRGALRGLASGIMAARSMLNLIYLTTKDNYETVVGSKAASEVALAAYDRIKKYQDLLRDAYEGQIEAINEWNDESTQSSIDNALKEFDDELDYVTIYEGPKERDPSMYDTYSILNQEYIRYWLNKDMEQVTGFALTVCDGVKGYDHSEGDSIGRDEFTSLMLKLRKDVGQ